jgi:DNA-binding response OmpR family regulator
MTAEAARAGTILVVDDDVDIVRFIEMNLRLEGYRVLVATEGASALEMMAIDQPDLVLLDVMMPGVDGIEVMRQLRSDSRTSTLPVIMLTAKTMTADRVLGLAAGANDYIIKPFDTLELVARVRSTLRRTSEARAVSPLTNLPGNVRIEEEIASRLASGQPFAVAYLDLDNFKAFNDAHGFLRGDDVIQLLATSMRRAVTNAEPTPFIGHVGGDDFVLVCLPAQVEQLAATTVGYFDDRVVGLHDPADLERGGIDVIDRQGQVRTFPLVSLSVGIASSERRHFADHREVVMVATEMKGVAKGEVGSAIAIDRRSIG